MSKNNGSIRASSIVWIFVAMVVAVLFGTVARSKIHASGVHQVVVSRVLAAAAPINRATPAGPERNPDREAFFGETHQHTSWSFDAYIFGNHVTGPADSYKYAKGETIKHPLGYDIRIDTPLDWMGVTDHSEYVGTVRLANEPGSFMSKLPIAKELVVHDAADIQRIYLLLGTSMIKMEPIKALVAPEIADN